MDEPTRARIQAAVEAHGARLGPVTPLHGGACQENFRVELTVDGAPLTLALRSDAVRSLPGSLRRRDEYAVVSAAAAAGVPTPRPRWLTADLLRPGADAYFLDWVTGEAIGRRVVRNAELEGARARLPEQLAAALARIHSVQPDRVPLPLPRPSSPAREALTALRALLERIPGDCPAVELALAWLGDRLPTREELVLVHGDFRTGNFLVTPEGLAAVLDWEFAHWGSPYEDLAWLSVRDWRFNRLDRPIGGVSRREPFYAAYTRATGREVDPALVHWWEVAGNLRWAVGSRFQGERHLSGEERNLELVAIARRSVEMEFEALRLIHLGRLDHLAGRTDAGAP